MAGVEGGSEWAPMAVEVASASGETAEQYDNVDVDQPTEEVEMSDEMIAFFRKTMEHRMERKAIPIRFAARDLITM